MGLPVNSRPRPFPSLPEIPTSNLFDAYASDRDKLLARLKSTPLKPGIVSYEVFVYMDMVGVTWIGLSITRRRKRWWPFKPVLKTEQILQGYSFKEPANASWQTRAYAEKEAYAHLLREAHDVDAARETFFAVDLNNMQVPEGALSLTKENNDVTQ